MINIIYIHDVYARKLLIIFLTSLFCDMGQCTDQIFQQPKRNANSLVTIVGLHYVVMKFRDGGSGFLPSNNPRLPKSVNTKFAIFATA